MIQFWLRTVKEQGIKSIDQYRVGCWIDVHSPKEEELSLLAEKFSLDIGHLRDSLDPNEVPRVEKEGDMLYVFLRVAYRQSDQTITTPLLFILAPDFFATVSQYDLAFLEKLSKKSDFFTTQKLKCFILYYMEVLNQFQNTLNSVGKKVGQGKHETRRIRNRDVLNLITYEQLLNEILSAIVPMNTSLEALLNGKVVRLYKQDRELMEDLFLGSGQIIALAKNRSVTLRNTREAYTTIMTNNLNQVVKLFTSLTVLLTIPTIVFSFYGMNVRLPLDEHHLAFAIIGGSTLTIVMILMAIFVNQDWL